MPICNNCHNPVNPGAKFCSYCGQSVSANTKCPGCGTDNAAGAQFCCSCGKSLAADSDATRLSSAPKPAYQPYQPQAPYRPQGVYNPGAPAQAAAQAAPYQAPGGFGALKAFHVIFTIFFIIGLVFLGYCFFSLFVYDSWTSYSSSFYFYDETHYSDYLELFYGWGLSEYIGEVIVAIICDILFTVPMMIGFIITGKHVRRIRRRLAEAAQA